MTESANFSAHNVAWASRAANAPITPGGINPLEQDPAGGFETKTEPPLAPNKSDIAKHLYALFAPEFVQPYPDSWIEIAYGDPAVGEGKPNAAKNFSPFKLKEAIAFADKQNRAGFNIYVGAALRHGERSYSGRASGHHVLAASHAWAEYEKAGDDERIAAILKDKSLVSAIVLTTGTVPYPRRHLYFKIDGSASPDDVRAANEALEKLLGTDNVKNPDRVMRLAGTVSYPPPKKKNDRGYLIELVRLRQNREARPYLLDELIGVAPGSGRSRGYNESEEKPAPTVESFFKDVNALALRRLSHWVKPLFGRLIKFYPGPGCWRTIPEANKTLAGRAHLDEAISISQRGVWDYGFEKPGDPIQLVVDYGPRESSLVQTTAKDAAFWLCKRMDITPEALGWGTRDRRSAEDAEYENGYDFGNAGARSSGAANDKGEKPKASLKWLNMSSWDGEPIPQRQWAIRDRVPLNQAGLFSGEGGTGKSIIELMKNVAHVMGKDWLGSLPEPGAAFYIGAEDDEDEIHIRLAAIAEHYGTTFKELIDGNLHVLPLLGQDATLCAVDKSGKVEVTGLYNQLFEAAGDIKPKNISIDTLSRAFAGNEIDRVQVYAFAMHMQALAKVAGGSVTVLSHPSLAGINSGSGISGSTAWHGAFRFRQYLKSTKPDGGEQPDNNLRELDFKKNQYGPLGESMVLRYQRGLFLPEGGSSNLEKLARENMADAMFLDLLRRFAEQGRNLSEKTAANNYAPTAFAEEPDAKKKGIRKADFKGAMSRLFNAGRIHVENYGRPSRPATRLAVKP